MTRMALSPSRAAEFRQCPLRYRLHAIDRVREDGDDTAAVRGTITHRHLDEVYDVPAPHRVPLLRVQMDAYQEFAEDVGACREAAIAEGVSSALLGYLAAEDPDLLDPHVREHRFEVTLAGVPVRGVIDRVDAAPIGHRVVDYKTGHAPREQWEAKAWWQLRLYACVLRAQGLDPVRLRLVYLQPPEVLDLDVTDADLDRFERTLPPLWAAITKAGQTGHFPPRTSRLCDWCGLHDLCPAQGGTPPPYPGWPDDQETT